MKRPITLAAVLAALLVLPACSMLGGGATVEPAPKTVLQRVNESGVLRVGLSGSQPPFNVKTRTGTIIGLDADLANAFADTIGARAEFIEKPFGELLPALEAGEVDMVISQMTMTPERNVRVAFAGPYFVSGKAILTKSETLARADEPSDINRAGLTISALAGSTSERFVKDAVPSARLIATADYDEAVKLVIEGGADAMLADMPICILSVLRNPNAGLSTITSPFTFEPIGIALPPGDPLYINLVQNYLNMLDGTGLLAQLQAKWFMDGSWLIELP